MLPFVLIVLLVTFDAQADIVSIGDWPCSEWQARRAASKDADEPQMWLSGFMTGLATAHDVDVLAITNATALFKSMDEFCRHRPDDVISSGGILFYNELRNRLPTSPPLNL